METALFLFQASGEEVFFNLGEAKVKKKEEGKGEREDQGKGKEAEGVESSDPRKNEVPEDGEEDGENEGKNEGKFGEQRESARDFGKCHTQSG